MCCRSLETSFEKKFKISFCRFEVKVDGCDHKLIIKDSKLDDADEYTAKIGDATSKAKLTVEGNVFDSEPSV